MAQNFITNNKKHKTLRGRLNSLISISDELKFLIGFFYFSGWKELFQSLKEREGITLKLLVGLQVDKLPGKMVIEHGRQDKGMSSDEYFNQFMTSLGLAINNEEMDTEDFYYQVSFFLEMLDSGRLVIRKTQNPNHSKVYLFKLNQHQAHLQGIPGLFITGSSNLTKAGLSNQDEFNVEIKDYGYDDAKKYFDDLWNVAIPISELEDRKNSLYKFITHRSQVATVTPYEAYALVLKTYLELYDQKKIKPEVEQLIDDAGFKKFSYQIDAVNQALSILGQYNGVIIADVVGLGKSVIASLIAKNIGRRGMIICPPALIGDKELRTGWWGYVQEFKLYDWEVESSGRLEDIAETIFGRDIEVIIVDEAHKYRNQDTTAYEALLTICRDKQVILLTATPFNNTPADIFSLLKLFLVPGKSGITLEDNLDGLFSAYNYRFKNLSYIQKNYNSSNPENRKKANKLYVESLGEPLPINIEKVKTASSSLAHQIKAVMAPVVIRRNRLDLKKDFQYQSEIDELSEVADPQELFFHLSPEQSQFYDKILTRYFAAGPDSFTGAIYQPFRYEKVVEDENNLDEAGNRVFQQQRNLFGFMRRILVKRFESSFGAFAKSIDRFTKIHIIVKTFIHNSGGKYILDRQLIEDIYNLDEEEIEDYLDRFANDLLGKKAVKNNTVYDVNSFELKDEFLADIDQDIAIFEAIQDEINVLDLVKNDPKRVEVYHHVEQILTKSDAKRKVIIFSEYVDTVLHLEEYFRKKLGDRLLVCDGSMTKELARQLNENFNAQYKGIQDDQFDVLITSDKLAEGVNLNRAGAIINYDIPWNPTRVIQRVGRINRIGNKVFDTLYIYNFFPSEIGADYVKSREIAAQKMFLIHNSLGEDSKIFNADEEPTPAGLFNKINENSDEDDELNISTWVRNEYSRIAGEHPEIIEFISGLPPRVKTAKQYFQNEINVIRRKGLSIFAQRVIDPGAENIEVSSMLFEELIPSLQCEFDEERLDLSPLFWPGYNAIKEFKPSYKARKSDISLESKAHKNLKVALKLIDPRESELTEFIKTLITDIKKYHTLSKKTLGRLGRMDLSRSSNKEVKQAFFDEVKWIRNHLGVDYLDLILERVKNLEMEVIIGVENRILNNKSR